MYTPRDYMLNRNGNFCKGNCVGTIIAGVKGDARVVQQNSPLVFVVCLQWQISCVLGALLWDNL